jgi:S-DNA-T family DNA segregation ATPase FtsK/SpoIIIE
VATEAQPTEQDVPPMPDWDPTTPAQTEPSRSSRIKGAFKEQRGHAGARGKEWLATRDLGDADIIDAAMREAEKGRHQAEAQLERRIAQQRARFTTARRMAEYSEQRGNDTYIAHLAGEIAMLESQLENLRGQMPALITDREIDKTRNKKKAQRAGIAAASVVGSLPVLGNAIELAASGKPLLIAVIGAGAAWGWYLVSRPFVAQVRQGAEVPFAAAPASLPAVFQGEQAGGAAPIIGGNVVLHVEQLAEGAKSYPIRNARTPQQLAECVLLAARAENVPIVEVSDVVRQPWGWQCTVRVDEGTPEAIITKSGDLETKFDLPTNGVRPQPIRARRACAILRLVDGDPFATAPGLPYRAPKSMSITDRFRIGTSVGGDPLEVSLAGVMGLWVAASGGGKTGILQALAEGTTACYDNITIDCDPHGDGLEDLGDAVRITARSNEQIEAVLLFFLVMSKARARLRAKLGMGKKWKASATHPAVTIFIDEFPKLSDLGKLLAFDLLLVGRKELIEVEYASQGGTSRYLGENIAQMMALKAVGPCKVGDTRAVFGDDSVREGYLPHKLSPATDTDPKDAGHIFIQGVPGMADEPIEYAIHEAPSAVLRQLAAERLEAGLLDPDHDSLDGMKSVDLPEYVEPEYDKDGNIKKAAPVRLLTWEQLLRLCDAEPAAGAELTDGPERAAIEDSVAVMEKATVDRMKTEALLAALEEYDPLAYGDMTVDEFKALMAKAGAGGPITLGPIGEEKNPRGFKRDRLRHLL